MGRSTLQSSELFVFESVQEETWKHFGTDVYRRYLRTTSIPRMSETDTFHPLILEPNHSGLNPGLP